MKEKVTIADIAKKLGIASSTVSRALKNNPNISDAVKEKIFAEAKKMGYGRVSTLVNKDKIVVIVPSLTSAVYSVVIETLSKSINSKKYLLSIHCSYHSEKTEKEIISKLDTESMTCLIISKAMDSVDSQHIEHLIDQNIPVIMFNRVDYSVATPKFVIDNYMESYKATKHLVEAGYKRIAFAAKHHNCVIFKERIRAYCDVLKGAGIVFDKNLLIHSELTKEDIIEVLNRFFNATNMPDAIILPNYDAGLQALYMAKNSGIDVPRQLGVLSFNDEKYCALSIPKVTSITHLFEEIGRDIASLVNTILNKKGYDKNMIPPYYVSDLIVRGSTLNSVNTR